jgi:hypothetical protein
VGPSHTFSVPPELAEQVDRLAASEHRTRNELFHEAFRRYLASKGRYPDLGRPLPIDEALRELLKQD